MTKTDYDGFYFVPQEDGNLGISYFKLLEANSIGPAVESTDIGDKYHVAFFRRIGDVPVFDDSFEAIFADPEVYVRNFLGSDIAGCILRKTEKSANWWDLYLTAAKKATTLLSANT